MRYTGSLYQLESRKQLPDGAYVKINGPWDTYGVVTSSAKQPDGYWLNQIRGIKKRLLDEPICSW